MKTLAKLSDATKSFTRGQVVTALVVVTAIIEPLFIREHDMQMIGDILAAIVLLQWLGLKKQD